MNEEKPIELKSPAVQEILGRPPRWIVRWGISIIFIIVAGLVVGSYFLKYPDILTATITVTTENLPVGIMAKTTGRIDTLFVREKQHVKQGDLLAVIENAARYDDILNLKKALDTLMSGDISKVKDVNHKVHKDFSQSSQRIGFVSFVNSLCPLWLKREPLHLGELQPTYNAFIKSLEDYQYFITTDYHHKKITIIKKQIQTQNLILHKSKIQLTLNSKQLEAAHQIFTIDSNLYDKKVLSNADYQNAKSTYLQHLQSFESAKLNIDNQNMSILQLEQSIFDLEQQRSEQFNNLQIALTITAKR